MGDAFHDWIAATAANADEFITFKLDVALADGANQYFQQLRIDCFRHLVQVIFGFVLLISFQPT